MARTKEWGYVVRFLLFEKGLSLQNPDFSGSLLPSLSPALSLSLSLSFSISLCLCAKLTSMFWKYRVNAVLCWWTLTGGTRVCCWRRRGVSVSGQCVQVWGNGDGVVQLVDHRTQDAKDRGSNPMCWLGVGVPNPCVYTRAQEWSCTHIKDPVVYVRVRWITETQKDPACTLLTGG